MLHYDDPDVHIPLEPGMTFTIEPMITVGSSENEKWADDWTVVTRDGSRTAQFEHTILVTADGGGDPHAALTQDTVFLGGRGKNPLVRRTYSA